MASLLDSEAQFRQRASELGIADDITQTLVSKGLSTMNKFGFSHGQPGQKINDEDFTDFLRALLGTAPDIGTLAAAKNLLFECHVFITASLKNRVEASTDAVKPVPLAERTSRLQALRNKYAGLDISHSLEPGHALLDACVHQAETKQLKYIPPSRCPSREQELMSNKTVNKTLEIEGSSLKVTQAIFVENSTEFLLYQALRRRGLALEFADLVTYTVHQKWVDFLFSELTKEPVKGFQKVQTFQILRADKAAWVHMADVCSDIRPSVGARPLDALFPTLTTVHSVVFTLFPMQGNLRLGKAKVKTFRRAKARADLTAKQISGKTAQPRTTGRARAKEESPPKMGRARTQATGNAGPTCLVFSSASTISTPVGSLCALATTSQADVAKLRTAPSVIAGCTIAASVLVPILTTTAPSGRQTDYQRPSPMISLSHNVSQWKSSQALQGSPQPCVTPACSAASALTQFCTRSALGLLSGWTCYSPAIWILFFPSFRPSK